MKIRKWNKQTDEAKSDTVLPLLLGVACLMICNASAQPALDKGTIKDPRDGKFYKTIKIGNQIWMAENLAYAPEQGNAWAYDNDQSKVGTYGYLYDWETAKRACLYGWHLPSKDEISALLQNVGGAGVSAYEVLAEDGKSGFSAVFGGWRGTDGKFYAIREAAHFWTSSTYGSGYAWSLNLSKGDIGLGYQREGDTHYYFRQMGVSVRCVKDDYTNEANLLGPSSGSVVQATNQGTAILEVARDGDLARVKALLQDNPELVSSKDEKGWTPLHYAAKSGHKDVAELLLASKADVNAREEGGDTPLHAAASFDQKEVAELLLAHKANVNARDKIADTPLHAAALSGSKDVAELLLVHNSDVKANDNYGRTPLHLAALQGHKDVAGLLLANKADVNAKANNGATPLHFAALNGRNDVVELLLAKQADVNAKDNNGNTPLNLAVEHRNQTAVALLRQHGGQE